MGSGRVFGGEVRGARPCQDLWAVVRRQEGGWRGQDASWGHAVPCAPCTRKVPRAAQLPTDPQGGARKYVLTSVDLVLGLFTSCLPACGLGVELCPGGAGPCRWAGMGCDFLPTHLCPQHDSHFSIFHAVSWPEPRTSPGPLSAQPMWLLCCVNSGERLPAKPCLPEPWMDTLCLSVRLL